jgi:hypothetical protein
MRRRVRREGQGVDLSLVDWYEYGRVEEMVRTASMRVEDGDGI